MQVLGFAVIILAVLLSVTACGGGMTGVAPPACPTPPATPPPSGSTGDITGCLAAVPAALGRATSTTPQPSARLARRPPNLPVFAPDRILVKFKPGVQSASMMAVHQQIGVQVAKTIAHLGVHVVRRPPGRTAQSVLADYNASPLVDYAEQDVYGYITAAVTPNDQYYPLQWHYPAIGLPAAWGIITGSSTIVAVIDTGIRSHPDLDGITVQGRDTFSGDNDPTDPGCPSHPAEFSHGMHVTGTIAALTNNSIGVAGVNWGGNTGIKIMPIRSGGEISGTCGAFLASDVVEGILYAADHGAKIINMSLAFPVAIQSLEDAVNYAYGLGVTLVAASGNESGPVLYPAKYPNVIAVAATACNNAQATYSNFGPEIDIAAPGGDIVDCTGDGMAELILSTSWSPNTGNVYLYDAGTSMATPHVSGVLALMIGRGITGPATLQLTLQNTATDLGTPGWDQYFGWGLVNAAAAVGGGTAVGQLRVFSGMLNGTVITRESDIVTVANTGAFAITNAQAGQKSVFAWQDFNGNGVVDAGDYYGKVDAVNVVGGATTAGVHVLVQRYSGPPISVL